MPTIVNIKQGSPEWHEWRAGGIGSSDMAAIFGISRFKSRYGLWREKVGLPSGDEKKGSDFILRRGHEVEEQILRPYASMILGEPVTSICVQGDLPWQRVSLDGMTLDGITIVEAKLLGKEAFLKLRDYGIVPHEYWPQLAHQLASSGCKSCLFVAHNDALNENAHIIVQAEQVCGSFDTIAAGSAFWELVQKFEEPEPDENETVVHGADDKAWLESAKAYVEAKAEMEAAQKRLEEASEAIKSMAKDGARRHEGGGVIVSTYTKRGNVDYAKIPALKGLDLDAFRKKASTVVAIRLKEAA